MHPLAAFPIMMGSDGLVQPVASLGFFRSGRFSHATALGIAMGGAVGVFVAFYIVKQLPLTLMRWLIVVVVTYAAVSLLRSAHAARNGTPATQ